MDTRATQLRYHPTVRGLFLGLGFTGAVAVSYSTDHTAAYITPQRLMFALAAGLLFSDLLEVAWMRIQGPANTRTNLDYLNFFYTSGVVFAVISFLQRWDPSEPLAAQFVDFGISGVVFGVIMLFLAPKGGGTSPVAQYYNLVADPKYARFNWFVAVFWTPFAMCILAGFAIFDTVGAQKHGYVIFLVILTLSLNMTSHVTLKRNSLFLMPRIIGTAVLLFALLGMGD